MRASNLSARLQEGLPETGTGLVVGFSGGLDSTVLLHALSRIESARRRGLRALHVDHGLHAESAAWAQHCRRICEQFAVPVAVARVQVHADGSGPEAAARRARWQAFATTAAANEILVLAQHRDDQAETVLLRLLRGAGPAGLAAMQPWSEHADGLRVWRPLLALARSELSAYAHQHALRWIEDPSNADAGHERNWLRHQLLPQLRQRWPQADASLAQVAQRQSEALALERECGRRLLARAATPDSRVLDIPTLMTAERPRRNAALRLWLHGLIGTSPGAGRLQRIEHELLLARADAEARIELPPMPDGPALVLRRHQDELHALAPESDRPLRYDLAWDGLRALTVPGAGRLSLEPAPATPLSLQVRSRRGGERLRLHPQRPRHRLKHLLQETGVPTWLRSRWPVLWLEGQPAGFADVVLGDELRAVLERNGSRLRFLPD